MPVALVLCLLPHDFFDNTLRCVEPVRSRTFLAVRTVTGILLASMPLSIKTAWAFTRSVEARYMHDTRFIR